MTPLQDLLEERIRRHGPMPFAAYMQLALYHPRFGYYAGGRVRSGWGGHFITSPELDPAYGSLWARGFEDVWERCGKPAEFSVVEVGPGEGGFAHAVLTAITGGFARALDYRLVERVPALEERQRARLTGFDPRWFPAVAEVPPVRHGVVFVNEVLDNLPVHVVERARGEVFEVCVDVGRDGLVESLRPPAGPELGAWLTRAGIDVPEGHRVEVSMSAESFVRRCAALFDTGALVVVDYGAAAEELARRPRGSLVTYSEEGAAADPLARPGEQDITSHVNWTVVARACTEAGLDVHGPIAQREVLRRLGAAEIDGLLRQEHARAVAEGRGVDAVRTLSRRGALGALLDPAGLGGLQVVIGSRGVVPQVARP
ncbi:MAG: SAM-dependent methyltransferase [Actinomycetota bacterium]|nr:SAM-dependent methyltransferase [Actinomycetota bacterium]